MPELELVPERMAAGGDAIARDATGRVVFVAGALPGERVRVRVVAERADFARAVVCEVVDASVHRAEPPCPNVARGCGGCQWQHVSPEAQRRLKEGIVADALRRIARIADPPLAPTVALRTEGYRTTLRLAVDPEGRAAFRRAGSHSLVVPGTCLVAHPLLAGPLRDGRFRGATSVTLRCGAATGERLVWAVPTADSVELPDDGHAAPVVAAPGTSGAWGAAHHEVVRGRRFRVSARSFFQASREGAEALVGLVLAAAEHLPPAHAVDLYSGVGLFAAPLAAAGWRVTAVETAASAVADARHNLAGLDARVVRADVARWHPRPAAFVVADPPRAGLGRAGVAAVVACGPERVVLVSCDPAAAARDTAHLLAAGYRLVRVTPVDMFAHTAHVEVVSEFAARGRHVR